MTKEAANNLETSFEPRTLSETPIPLSEEELYAELSQEVLSEKNVATVWSLGQVGLLKLLKALCHEKQTALIQIRQDAAAKTDPSEVGLIDGTLVLAKHGQALGKDAIFVLARVKQGSFTVSNELVNETNIEEDTSIILEELTNFLNSEETAVLGDGKQRPKKARPSHIGASLSSTANEMSGELVLNRYRIVKELGKGGMGAVLLGRDDLSGQEVAIKILPESLADDEKAVARFDREAQALARLDHPNIVPLLTYAVDGAKRYIVMKYVAGDTLQSRIEKSKMLSFQECRFIIAALLDGLSYAHQHGVVHRDIKPGNVLTTEHDRVYLADFGIAKMQTDLRLTRPDMVVGSPQYMSPEQVTGKEISPATDLYSCGLILFEMLTGRPPFTATAEFSIMRMQLESDAPSPSKMRGELIPLDLLYLLAQLLKKKPSQRPADAQEAKQILEIESLPQRTELETMRSFVGETGYRDSGGFEEETEDLESSTDLNSENDEIAKEKQSSNSETNVQVIDFDQSSLTKETSSTSLVLKPVYTKPSLYIPAAFGFLLVCFALIWGLSSGDDAEGPAQGHQSRAVQSQAEPSNPEVVQKQAPAESSSPVQSETTEQLSNGQATPPVSTAQSESGKSAEKKPQAKRASSKKKTISKSRAPKRSSYPKKTMSQAKAQLKKLRAEAYKKGILRSDSKEWSQFISRMEKQIATKRESGFQKTAQQALKHLKEIRIDRSFVDRKLQRFNRRYGQISDQRKRKVVDKRFVHVINAMTAGNYKKANVELNRCFAELK